MKFCTIYEVKRNELSVVLSKVVSCKDLTQEQLRHLAEYFEENTPVVRFTQQYDTATFTIFNNGEILEDSPLPDGTVIMAEKFEEGGEYAVVLGHTNINTIPVKIDLEI